jgi:hypothetical protein
MAWVLVDAARGVGSTFACDEHLRELERYFFIIKRLRPGRSAPIPRPTHRQDRTQLWQQPVEPQGAYTALGLFVPVRSIKGRCKQPASRRSHGFNAPKGTMRALTKSTP